MEESEDVVEVEYVIHVEFNNQVWPYTAMSDMRVEAACKNIHEILVRLHVPLTNPPHALFYDPDTPENLSVRQINNIERINSARGARISSELSSSPPRSAVDPTQHKSSASALRALASLIPQQEVEIKTELPSDVIEEV